MSHPSVSIPITSYNQADFIHQAVISAVEQEYDDLQVVVCDDASTDSSQEILLDIASQYPQRVELHFNEKNLGGGRNRIQSLLLARGELVTYLDGDDIFLPGKIQRQVDFMQTHPDCTLCYHNVEVFESTTGERIYDWKNRFGSGDGDVKKLVRYGNYLCTLSIMFRRECLSELPFYEQVRVGQDWIILIHILMNGSGKYGYIDEVLARYRRHAANLTLDWHNKLDSQLNALNIIQDRYPQFTPQVRMRRAEIFLVQAFLLARQKNLAGAGTSVYKSVLDAFPRLWTLLRLPTREFAFWIKTGRHTDRLLSSLLEG